MTSAHFQSGLAVVLNGNQIGINRNTRTEIEKYINKAYGKSIVSKYLVFKFVNGRVNVDDDKRLGEAVKDLIISTIYRRQLLSKFTESEFANMYRK